MLRSKLTFLVLACSPFVPAVAHAHVSIASGPAVANVTQEVAFGVGHGCEGADTVAVSIEIPTGVTSVRPMTSGFGQVDVMTDDAGAVVLVNFSKPDALALDTQYYKLIVRMKPPDEPLSTIFFPAHQTCRAEDGTETVVDWVGLDETETDVEPAATLFLLPARFPGWNRFTAASDVANLAAFFPDAEIVWSGNSAFSMNPTTTELIASTEGVTALEALASGDDVWVKY